MEGTSWLKVASRNKNVTVHGITAPQFYRNPSNCKRFTWCCRCEAGRVHTRTCCISIDRQQSHIVVPCKRLQKNRAAGCLPRSPDEPLSQLYFIDLLQSKDTFESRKHRIGIKSDQGYDQRINCQ